MVVEVIRGKHEFNQGANENWINESEKKGLYIIVPPRFGFQTMVVCC